MKSAWLLVLPAVSLVNGSDVTDADERERDDADDGQEM
jgi:hypothetical protein